MAHGRFSSRTASGALPPVIMEAVDPVMNPIPAVGEHTDAILRELGIDDETIAAWRHSGMI